MAKRHQDTQLTKDDYLRRADGGGGPDDSTSPVKLASEEVMKRRTIKQPKSRLSSLGATTPVPTVPEPIFSFDKQTSSAPSTTPSMATNGISVGLLGGPTTPVGKPFAAFGALNGTPSGTPAPQPSPTKPANPFAVLGAISSTPAGKPPSMFGASTTPSTTPAFGGGSTSFGLFGSSPVKKEDEIDGERKPNPFASLGQPSTTPAGAPAAAPSGLSKPAAPSGGLFGSKPLGTSTSLFGSDAKIGDATKSASGGLFGAKNTQSQSLFGKKPDEGAKPSEVTSANLFGKKYDEAAKPTAESLFGNKPEATSESLFGKKPDDKKGEEPSTASSLFGKKPEEANSIFGKKAEEASKPPTAESLFGFGKKPAEISSSVSSKALDDWQESFSRLAGSKPPESLFGFGKKAEETPKPAATTDGLFGSKSPVSLNAQSTSSDDVSYPSLLAAPASNALATINGNSAQVTTNSVASLLVDLSVPPPPPHYTDEDKESYDRLYKIKALNSSLLRALQAADWSADWRGVLSVYSQIYEQITGPGTHKRKEPQAGNAQNVSSPKRSKQDDAPSKQAPGSAAAKLFGEIVDKNMGSSPTVGAALFGFGKPAEPKSTPEKPTTSQSAIFGNAFSTPPSNQEPKPSTPPSSSKSNLFSAGGGAAIDHGHGTSGGLFANLKPTINVQKDKGEEDDSPQKPGPGLGLFGDKSKGGDSSSIVPPSQPSFFFGAPNKTSTPEKPTGSTAGPFGSASKLGGDHTWKPDTPIKFGPPASGLFGSSASTSSAGGEAKSLFGTSATAPGFSFSSGSASSTSTATPNAANTPSFTFGAGTSAAQSAFKLAPPVSAPRSGLSTPGDASSDPDSAKPPPSDVTSSEPSDDVPTTKTDLSGLGPGEENDEVLFTVRVAVYSKDDKGAMKKIGVGASRVLKDKTSGKSRFLVRTEQGKVVVNVRLHKGVEYTCFAEKKVVMVPDFSGGGIAGGKPRMYTVRTKDEAGARELGRWLGEVRC